MYARKRVEGSKTDTTPERKKTVQNGKHSPWVCYDDVVENPPEVIFEGKNILQFQILPNGGLQRYMFLSRDMRLIMRYDDKCVGEVMMRKGKGEMRVG